MEYSKKNKENPAKIIRWQNGQLECFSGTLAEAENYAEQRNKVIKQNYVIVWKRGAKHLTPLSSKYQDGTR